MIQRLVNPLKSRSFFLFGARGTGKSTFLKSFFSEEESVLWIDLLDSVWERRLRADPSSLLTAIQALKVPPDTKRWIVIDEVQKCPKILDLVHKSIFSDKNTLFALTGSSARKLKRDGANMLAGRALSYSMFPMTHLELGSAFDLNRALAIGTLPEISCFTGGASDRESRKFLEAYCQTYMKEEVFAEQLARRLDPFRSFMECAAQDNGHTLNFESIGKKIGVSGKTVNGYYKILVDTYLGILLYPAHPSFRKKIAQKPKFYFFDLGVQRCLSGTLDIPMVESTNDFGDAFEHWVILEAWRLNELCESGYTLGYLDNYGGLSVDLVLEKPRRNSIYIEIKSTKTVMANHLKHLKIAKKSDPGLRCICLSRDSVRRIENGVEVMPWDVGLTELFVKSTAKSYF